jgi:SnoaL-like domain
LSDVVSTYCSAWCEADSAFRQELLEKSWADEAVYRDPTARAEGRAALHGPIGGYHEQFPGARIVPTSGVDEHDGLFRFGWAFVTADGVTQIEGIDFGTVAADGRIGSIAGFFGPLPDRARA